MLAVAGWGVTTGAGAAEHRHELRECDRLHLAVLPHLEVGGGQVRDGAAVGVGDDRVDADDVDAYPELGGLGRALRRWWRRIVRRE